MSKTTRTEKKPIEQYDHKGKERCNNPPVGRVTPETDREDAKKTCGYDPHLTQISKFFFIVAPGLTVKSRLEVLQLSAFGNYMMNSILFED